MPCTKTPAALLFLVIARLARSCAARAHSTPAPCGHSPSATRWRQRPEPASGLPKLPIAQHCGIAKKGGLQHPRGRGMRCAKCGFKNLARMKFCGQCTAPLVLVCSHCQFQNPLSFKFCGQCAAALPLRTRTKKGASAAAKAAGAASIVREEASRAVEGERKTVTALFADIKGSTELEEDLDPEEARAIVDPALKLMIEAVRRYDGYIVQSTGDGIFALFGAPVARKIIHSALSTRHCECRRN